MRKQTGLDKKTVLNVRPGFLIVPSALELAAAQDRYLSTSSTGLTGLDDFEVWAVASIDNPNGNHTIAGVWNLQNQRSWRLIVDANRIVQFQVSRDGTSLTVDSVPAAAAIPNNSPVLIRASREDGVLRLTVDAVDAEPVNGTNTATHSSTANFALLTSFNPGALLKNE